MSRSGLVQGCAALLVCAAFLCARTSFSAILPQAPQSSTPATTAQASGLTLDQAIAAALANDPAYASAVANTNSARLDASISRGALLPNAAAHGQYLYTQPNGLRNQAGQIGSQEAPRFIANNAIREYAAQVLVNQNISLASVADYRRARALAAQATADLESARRDLVARTVAAWFSVLSTSEKVEVAHRALSEAQAFVDLTGKLEGGREVAHADVVKANLAFQQRQREFDDATLAAEKARLDLGVLLFPDPRTPYTLSALDNLAPLPDEPSIQAAASHNNPDLRSALEAMHAAQNEVLAARAAYLPALSFNYAYGIDAPQLAVNGPQDVRNLGYSASASIDFPVWNWFATHDRVRQSQLHEKAAQANLTNTQRQLIAQLDEFYHEARVATDQVDSLHTSVDTARESLRLTRLRYSSGEATALEVVDAQSSLALAEAALADGILRSHVARANLQTLTGTL
jgi:outer membrane protein TolC